jgi:hypothetical protein
MGLSGVPHDVRLVQAQSGKRIPTALAAAWVAYSNLIIDAI